MRPSVVVVVVVEGGDKTAVGLETLRARHTRVLLEIGEGERRPSRGFGHRHLQVTGPLLVDHIRGGPLFARSVDHDLQPSIPTDIAGMGSRRKQGGPGRVTGSAQRPA